MAPCSLARWARQNQPDVRSPAGDNIEIAEPNNPVVDSYQNKSSMGRAIMTWKITGWP
jgi:hypothetical protein